MRGTRIKAVVLSCLSLCLFAVAYFQLPNSAAQSFAANLNLPFVVHQDPAVAGPIDGVSTYTYKVLNTWQHDRGAFTQGLIFHDGILYESTGLYGQSSLRKVELTTGNVLQKIAVPGQYFAEGMTLLGDKLYQLTWQNRVGFVYDRDTFVQQREFTYTGEGWGLTTDQQSLIMSDGTHQIRFLDPETFAVQRTISVLDNGQPLFNLNELEYVKGEIYANIWQTDRVVRINPRNGAILGWIDFAGLLTPEERNQGAEVLNGIAYDAASNRLFVTGKLWPKLFEVQVERQRARPRSGITTP